MNNSPRRSDEHRPVHHNWRRLDAADRIERIGPGEPEPAHCIGGYAGERAKAGDAEIKTHAGPFAPGRCVGDDPGIINASEISGEAASTAEDSERRPYHKGGECVARIPAHDRLKHVTSLPALGAVLCRAAYTTAVCRILSGVVRKM